MGSIPIMAYEIRTKASMQTMIMRWVFSLRGFTDEDNNSLVVATAKSDGAPRHSPATQKSSSGMEFFRAARLWG
jgi:hypothetical protein